MAAIVTGSRTQCLEGMTSKAWLLKNSPSPERLGGVLASVSRSPRYPTTGSASAGSVP
ncbi:MAG: hypothetical protein AAGF75_08585 [Cyanobacteria bacterium P01_H01_bin.130]